MCNLYSDKDYSSYTFEDFLQDEFFISTIKNPTKESLKFWQDLEDNGKINLEEFNSAKYFIESVNSRYDNIVYDPELTPLWQTGSLNDKRPSQSGYKKFIYIGISVAACILFAVFAVSYFTRDITTPEDDILSFVRDNQVQDNNQSDIQIIISDQKTLQISDKESDIVYDSTEIKIDKKGSFNKKESASYNQLLVPKGKRSKLTLSDGTKIHVNAGTQVVYPVEFRGNTREIYVNGEIYIEVAHDVKRPFIVKTNDMGIQVLGTKFNVMAYNADNNKQVVLTSGSVKILSKDNFKGEELKPSQMFEYNKGKTSIKKVNTNYYTSWVNGLYIFESERLDAVLLRLSRYYDVNIECSKDIASLKCSGKMDLKDNLSEILDGLSFSFPIKVEQGNGSYNIKSN